MKPDFRAIIFLTGFVLYGCAETLRLEDALTVVPYEVQRSGRIVVDVEVNDRGPFRFALDTAATISSVFDELRADLGLEIIPDTSATVHGVVASGEFPLVSIDRLRLGNAIWSEAEIVSLPGETRAASGIAGILGIDFLRRYGVAVSTADRALRLYSPERVSENSYRGWANLALEPVRFGESSEPLYFFEMRVAGRAIPALFDLGAGVNLINASGAQSLRLVLADAREESFVAGALDTAPVLARLESEVVTTGGARWRNEEFLIGNLEIFSTLMYEDSPLAILGSGLFNQRDFVIDFVRNRLLIRVAMNEIERAP